MDMYREEILEHWKNPQNFGVLKNADLVIEQINPICGDEITFFFKFKKEGNPKSLPSRQAGEARNPKQASNSKFPKSKLLDSELRIADVKFTGSGCAISIASASILSENIRNKKISALSKITGEDVLKLIGGSVAPARLKCAFLALEVVKKISH